MKSVASLLLAATVLAVSPAPAAAEIAYGASVAPRGASYSKAEAILGGAPSSLAAILASQGAVKSTPTPASYGAPYRPAVLTAPRIAPADRPDVFGSVALPIPHASLERHWRKVGNRPIGAAAAAFVATLDGLSDIERLDAVNRYVNARVEFTDDSRQFGAADLWLAAADTLRRGRGDCEDFAIAKLQMLRHAGIADKNLYLVILRDVSRRADHAVLVVRADDRLLVLDNGTNRIVDSDSVADYRPIMTFSGNRSWTHGYRRTVEAPIQHAEASPPVTDGASTAAYAAAALPTVTVSIAF